MKLNMLNAYQGKRILITGGLGFIGSSLAQYLVKLGAQVTLLDNLDPLYGGNPFNVAMIKSKLVSRIGDVRDEALMTELVKNQDIIFHLAAQVSYRDSKSIPFDDLEINARSTLHILETCRLHNPGAKIMFASSRLVLGKIVQNLITEEHPTAPLSLYGIHKLTSERYCQWYAHEYKLRTTVMRIANPYGPRQQIKHDKYSIPGWFLRLAMENKPIPIYGNGEQLRDYIYADDITEAFLRAGATTETDGHIYNCGTGKSIAFKEMAESIVKTVGKGSIEYIPWPANFEKDETGSCELDMSKLKRVINWEPATSLESGISLMYTYYKKNWDHYMHP